jgi:archaellum component FlaC
MNWVEGLQKRVKDLEAEVKLLTEQLEASESAYKSIMKKVHKFGDKVLHHIDTWE